MRNTIAREIAREARRKPRAPKYSIAYDSKRSGERQRGQFPQFSSYADAKKHAASLNASMPIKGQGKYVVIEL